MSCLTNKPNFIIATVPNSCTELSSIARSCIGYPKKSQFCPIFRDEQSQLTIFSYLMIFPRGNVVATIQSYY